VLATDFVLRPQSWFVSDLDTGAPLVRRLFLLDQDKGRLAFFLRQHGVTALPRLNASSRVPLSLSPRQKFRIEKPYLGDFELVAALRHVWTGRGFRAHPGHRGGMKERSCRCRIKNV
jgi:hypothetical protein